jgi:monofunctional biosynthetic peptidoglycan transglycosylase
VAEAGRKRAEKGRGGAREATRRSAPRRGPARWLAVWTGRLAGALAGLVLAAVLAYAVVDPPTTPTIRAEERRLGAVARTWVPLEAVAPVMRRSVVAAEDANFCRHWGFDMAAIREALAEGAERGASTITQQVVKNAYLWQGRSWLRKALEALITPLVEAVWSKRRILEVYLNIAEFGEGIFGVEAAARAYFRVPAAELTAAQAARLAVLLPNPRARDPRRLTPALQRRAARVADGAATIRADGRAACFDG